MLDAPKRFLLSALAGKMCNVTKQLYSGNGTCRISDLVVAAVVALFFFLGNVVYYYFSDQF